MQLQWKSFYGIYKKIANHFQRYPKDILIMDNCAFHHRKDTISLLNEVEISYGFLPLYSPCLNPIYEYFSHLKSHWASITPANREAIIRNVTNIIKSESISFEGWFRHMRMWIDKILINCKYKCIVKNVLKIIYYKNKFLKLNPKFYIFETKVLYFRNKCFILMKNPVLLGWVISNVVFL